jgi:hypothetical protein
MAVFNSFQFESPGKESLAAELLDPAFNRERFPALLFCYYFAVLAGNALAIHSFSRNIPASFSRHSGAVTPEICLKKSNSFGFWPFFLARYGSTFNGPL